MVSRVGGEVARAAGVLRKEKGKGMQVWSCLMTTTQENLLILIAI